MNFLACLPRSSATSSSVIASHGGPGALPPSIRHCANCRSRHLHNGGTSAPALSPIARHAHKARAVPMPNCHVGGELHTLLAIPVPQTLVPMQAAALELTPVTTGM